MANGEILDNDKCIVIVRKIQTDSASEEEKLFLWEQTCHYIRKGIEQRAYHSRHDPCMSTEDLQQELWVRIPTWAKTFPLHMSSWGQWARSCWWRWSTNNTQYHGRHRPHGWISTDAVVHINNLKENRRNTIKQDTYEEIIDLLNNRWNFEDEDFKEAIYKYLYNRIVCSMSKRESADKASKKHSHESFRQWEIEIIEFYKLYLLGM